MIRIIRNPGPRRAALWLAAAVVLWLLASVVDRRTELVIENLGHHLRFSVAGTELVIPDTFDTVERITILAADSIDPPEILLLETAVDDKSETLVVPRNTPQRNRGRAPVGDWWVDGHLVARELSDQPVRLTGAFVVHAVLRGRISSELHVILTGHPTVTFSLQRGLLDNYMAIRGSDGTLIDVTTLDPTPTADLRALAAQLLRVTAAALMVLVIVGAIALIMQRKDSDAGATAAGNPRHGRLKRIGLPAAVLLAVMATAISVWTAVDVLAGLPHQIDEVVYLIQAKWLLDGNVAPAATAIQEHLRVPFTYLVDGRWIGHYPVGWPALLVIGLAVGAPHLVAPAIGALFVVLLFLVGREIDDPLTGLAAASLAVASPLLRLLSASFFPHVACATLVLLALWLLLLSRRLSGWWYGAGAGFAMGCCLAVRPMPAVAVSAVFGGWLVLRALNADRSRSTWFTVGAATAAGLVASLPTLVHNTVVTGHPLTLPYSLTPGTMYNLAHVPFGIRNLDAILVSASASLTGWGWPVMVGGLALALPIAFVAIPFLLRRSTPDDRLLLSILLVIAIAHLPTRASGLHGYGARYVVDVSGCLFLLAGRGFRELARWAGPSRIAVTSVAALFLGLNIGSLATLPQRLVRYSGYYGVTGDLERELASTGLPRAVILLEEDDWTPWGEGARLMTGPRRHDIVIGTDLGNNSAITEAYPDLPVLRWDGEHLNPDNRGAD